MISYYSYTTQAAVQCLLTLRDWEYVLGLARSKFQFYVYLVVESLRIWMDLPEHFQKSSHNLMYLDLFKPPYEFLSTSELSLETKSLYFNIIQSFSVYISFTDHVDVSTKERIERSSYDNRDNKSTQWNVLVKPLKSWETLFWMSC